MFGCVDVDWGGTGLSLSFLAFGKDLNYVNNRHREAMGTGEITVQTPPAQSRLFPYGPHIEIREDPENRYNRMTNPCSWT